MSSSLSLFVPLRTWLGNHETGEQGGCGWTETLVTVHFRLGSYQLLPAFSGIVSAFWLSLGVALDLGRVVSFEPYVGHFSCPWGSLTVTEIQQNV